MNIAKRQVGFLLRCKQANVINHEEITSASQRIVEAFAGIPQPNLNSIHPLGCCDEHESDFEWYRHHSCQEFEKELSSERFDPFEFTSLNPLAYHYFVPGILLAVLNSIAANPDSLHLWEQDWVGTLIPLKENAANFRRNYLPLFSSRQKEAVASGLELFNRWHFEKKAYRDEDIQRAIEQIWRKKEV